MDAHCFSDRGTSLLAECLLESLLLHLNLWLLGGFKVQKVLFGIFFELSASLDPTLRADGSVSNPQTHWVMMFWLSTSIIHCAFWTLGESTPSDLGSEMTKLCGKSAGESKCIPRRLQASSSRRRRACQSRPGARKCPKTSVWCNQGSLFCDTCNLHEIGHPGGARRLLRCSHSHGLQILRALSLDLTKTYLTNLASLRHSQTRSCRGPPVAERVSQGNGSPLFPGGVGSDDIHQNHFTEPLASCFQPRRCEDRVGKAHGTEDLAWE